MYKHILTLHSYWAFIVIVVLLVAIVNAFLKRAKGSDYTHKDFRIALFGLIVTHLQFVIGLILYFVSPKFQLWSELGGGVMKNSEARLYLVEHPTINILAIVLITIGYSKHKKITVSDKQFKTILLFYLIGLVLLLSRIPYDVWPRF